MWYESRRARNGGTLTASVEQDRPRLDRRNREHPVLVPTILRESFANRLLRRTRDRVQDLPVTSERSPQHDEPILDEGVHESCVFIPPVLVAQIPRPIPRPAALQAYGKVHPEHVTPNRATEITASGPSCNPSAESP